MVFAIIRYSASVDERETVLCFLDFHKINDSPRKMQNPLMDLLVSLQATQSELVKALSKARTITQATKSSKVSIRGKFIVQNFKWSFVR